MKRWTGPLLLSAAVVAGPPAALAEPVSAVSAHTSRGDAARNAGRCADAVGFYRSALEEAARAGVAEKEQAAIAGELGLCEIEIGRFRDAAEHLRRSVVDLAALPPWKRTKLAGAYTRATKEVASVTIGVNASDAEVLIDDKPIGAGEATYIVFLDPGDHTARARLSRHRDAVSRLTAVRGTSVTITLQLAEAEKPAPAPPVPLRPVAPAARDAPPVRDETAIALRRVGYASAGTAAVVGAGCMIWAAAVHAELLEASERQSREHGPSSCTSGRSSPACDELRAAGAKRDVLRGVGIAGLVAAGVLGGVTISSHWWAPAERSVHVVPTVDPEHAGVTLRTTW